MSGEQEKNPLNQFCSGATSSRYQEFSGETLINATVIPNVTPTSRSPAMLVPRLGRVLFHELTGIVLAWKSYSINRYVIVRNTDDGAEILLLDIAGTFVTTTVLKTLTQTVDTRPLAVDTYDSCVIAVNDIGYTISNTFTITEIVGDGWVAPSSMCFIDGYVLISKKDSRQFLRSELNGSAFTDLINFSATQSDDSIVNIANINNNLFVFSQRHTEVWWNSGVSPDQPFTRQDGVGTQYGTVSFNTLVIDGVGYNVVKSETIRGVFMWTPQAQKISVDAVDQDLEGKTDVVVHSSIENGRRFIHIVIDNGSNVWTYDLLSQSWHQRTNQQPIDYFPNTSTYFYVDAQGIHTIEGNLDNDEPITCTRRSPHIMNNGLRMFHKLLEIDAGGSPGLIEMQYSNDSGRTWYNVGFTNQTQLGVYNRYRFNRIGSSIDRIYQLRWTDVNIYAAFLMAESGVR